LVDEFGNVAVVFQILRKGQDMLPPHWLDSVFENIANCETKISENSHFKEAISEAKSAHKEAVDFQKKNPGMIGPSPAQKARQAFLEIMDAS